MSKAMKAALMSAFLFPGLGHLLLKKRIHATVLALTAFTSLFYLISKAVEKAQEIAAKIQAGEVPMDNAKIIELIQQQETGGDAQLQGLVTLLLIVVWLFGFIDSYRLGSQLDRQGNSSD